MTRSQRVGAGRLDPNTDSSTLEVAVYNNFEALASVADEWDEFVSKTGSDIYFTTDWLEVWWHYYGQGRLFHGLLIRENQKIVAAMPFAIEHLGVGPARLRLARFVGADSTIPVFFPAIQRSYEREVVRVALGYLLDAQHCDCVSLSPLSGLSPVADAVRALICSNDEQPAYALARFDSSFLHTVLELPDCFDTFISNLTKRARSNYRRDLRNISEKYSLRHRPDHRCSMKASYIDFVELHQEQWQSVGRRGHFGDWPLSFEFNRDLVERLVDKGRVRFYELWGNEELLSSQLCFILADRCYWRLPARKTDSTLEKLGFGRIGMVKMIEALIDEGVRHIEAGPGKYDYKRRHGGSELPLHRVVVSGSSFKSRLKTRLTLACADFLHLAYYRIWYLRLADRLHMPKRTLWRAWCRSRL